MTEKAALVTGASRGIGRGIALALAKKGWCVAVNYKGDRIAAEETLRDIEAAGAKGQVVQADISQAADRQRLLDSVLNTFGRIDLLVNNAGMAPRQRLDLLEMSETSYDEVMSVNLKGPFFLTQAVAKKMIELVHGEKLTNPVIINIGSISAYTSSIPRGEYCLSKAGMAMMTILFADRLAAEGILVYEIRPGLIDTDMTSGVKQKYDQQIAGGLLPLARWGQPEDVANAVLALADGCLSYSTGEVINVDGGFHLRRL
jgi:3-oxoacyl-[acyl-carrier protein] reductase